jgi:TonB family protein
MSLQFFSILVVASLSAAWLSATPVTASEAAKHTQAQPIVRDAAFGSYKIGMTFAQFQAIPLPPPVHGESKVEMGKMRVGPDMFDCQFHRGELPPFRSGSPTFTFNGTGDDSKLVNIWGDVDVADIEKFAAKLQTQYGSPKITTSQDGLATTIKHWSVAGNTIDIQQNNNLLANVEFASASAPNRIVSKPHADTIGFPRASQRPSAVAGDVDFGPYMADLQRRIKKHWFPPKGMEAKRVVTRFKVHREGALSDLRLDKSSGVLMADQAGLKAVQDASPFRPLPTGAPEAVDVQFTFDYNVFNGGGHGVFRLF